MQGTFTLIFVRFRSAVFENECPSIHGVREYIAYSMREVGLGGLPIQCPGMAKSLATPLILLRRLISSGLNPLQYENESKMLPTIDFAWEGYKTNEVKKSPA